VVEERTGLLINAGGDRYQFVHLSLHEYLVARYVLDRLDEDDAARVLRHYLHDPQWAEVNQLLVAGAPEARAESLVRAVLREPPSERGDYLRRDLRFVCRCLGDGAAVSGDLRRELYLEVETELEKPNLAYCFNLMFDAGYAGAPAADLAARSFLSYGDGKMRETARRYFKRFSVDATMCRIPLRDLGSAGRGPAAAGIG
jgi:hypothetical protein